MNFISLLITVTNSNFNSTIILLRSLMKRVSATSNFKNLDSPALARAGNGVAAAVLLKSG